MARILLAMHRFTITTTRSIVHQIRKESHFSKQLRPAAWLAAALTAVSLHAGAAPYSGTPAALPATLEAENFDTGGEGVGYHDLTASNTGGAFRTSEGVDIIRSLDSAGGGYVVNNFQTGEWLAYTVNAPASGSYNVALRAASNYSSMKPSFHIEVDGTKVTGSVAVPLTGSWSNFQWVDAPAINLSAGQHTIRIVADAQYFNLNQIRFDAGTVAAPSNPAPANSAGSYSGTPYTGTPIALPAMFEAENFDKGGEGVAYHDLTPGNVGGQYRTAEDVDIVASTDSAGGGYVIMNFQTGEWLAYTVNVAANGTYDLSVRVSHTDVTTPKLHMEVDGVDVTGPITVPETGSWDTFQWIGKTGVSLSAGKHVIKLVADAEYFRLNQISVLASAPSAPAPAPTPALDPQVLWRASMEAGNLSEWDDQMNSGSASSAAVTAASAGIPQKSGSWVMQQSITSKAESGTRMERYPEIESLAKSGTPFYVSWWDYYPARISFSKADFFSLWQVVSRDSGGVYHPIWTLNLDGSNSTLQLIWSPDGNAPSPGPHAGESGKRLYASNAVLPVGQWVFFEVMMKPASDFTGAIKVWMNGVPVFDQSNVKMRFPDGGSGGWMGVTHNAYGSNLTPIPATHYVDDVTISLGRMTYAP